MRYSQHFFRVWNASSHSAFQTNFSSFIKDQWWVWKCWRSLEWICDSSLAKPRKLRTWCTVLGGFQSSTSRTLPGSTDVPSEDMTQEPNFTQPELTVAELRIKLMIMQSLKHNAKMLFILLEKNKMWSMKTMTNLSISSMKTEFIKYMKWAGALARPKDITRYSSEI
jgi:hypothetical protein